MEKEREKARLKKLEREKAQKEKEENRQKALARKREDAERAVEETVSESAALAVVSKPVTEAKIKPQTEEEQRAEAKKAAAAAAAREIAKGLPKPTVSPISTAAAAELDEASLGKLFELLDRNNKGQVSQRDVLVALRKHPPIRRLFGLPVTNVEEGGDRLEARLLAIQDAFEAGSGLGEAKATFEELKAGAAGESSESTSSCSRESFFSSCKAGETLRARAVAAAAILPREHSTGAAFVATHEWRVVPPDAACPGGLEYKMDMESGRTMARLPPSAKKS